MPVRHFWVAPRNCAPHASRSEEHTSDQSLRHLVCRLLLEKNECAALRSWITCRCRAPFLMFPVPAAAALCRRQCRSYEPTAVLARHCTARIRHSVSDQKPITQVYSVPVPPAPPL